MQDQSPRPADLLILKHTNAVTVFLVGCDPDHPQLSCKTYEEALHWALGTAKTVGVDVWYAADRKSKLECVGRYRGQSSTEDTTKIRTLIAHGHRLFVAGLQRLLPSQFDVVETTEDLLTLPDSVRRVRPDLVVQGLSEKPQIGLDAISLIQKAAPSTRIVIVTRWEEAELVSDAFRRGATAYIPMTATDEELLRGITAALTDTPYVAASLSRAAIDWLVTSAADQPDVVTLTERQRAVVRLLAQGKTMKEAAAALHITARTVAFHKYEVMAKLKLNNSAELVRFAVKHRLV